MLVSSEFIIFPSFECRLTFSLSLESQISFSDVPECEGFFLSLRPHATHHINWKNVLAGVAIKSRRVLLYVKGLTYLKYVNYLMKV